MLMFYISCLFQKECVYPLFYDILRQWFRCWWHHQFIKENYQERPACQNRRPASNRWVAFHPRFSFVFPRNTWQILCGNFTGTFKVKAGMAQMAKGGIVMDVVNVEQAKIAEAAGVCGQWNHMIHCLNLLNGSSLPLMSKIAWCWQSNVNNTIRLPVDYLE